MTERATNQKNAILNVLKDAQMPMGVSAILSAGQKVVPSLSQATVYRVLKSMIEKGIADVVQLPGSAPLYEMSGKAHHHFFRCRLCEKMFEIAGCDRFLHKLTPKGFALEEHEMFLFGLCAACKKQS